MENLTIGQRIAAKRKELGLSQIALGEQMGVSRQSISNWEADAAIPEIDKLIALSKLFNVSVGWLLGVEEVPDPAGEAETCFTDREWEIIDRLTQSQPHLPKWLVPLTAAAAAVALFAAILAGAALSAARSYREDLATVSQVIANLTTAAEDLIPNTQVLESHQFRVFPSADLSECSFDFSGYPFIHEEDAEAEIFVILGGQEVLRESCEWNGLCYTASITLPTRNGYEAYFTITSKDGIARSTTLFEPLLSHLESASAFGKVSVGIQDWDYDGGVLTLRNIRFLIDGPDVFRDITDLWNRCDLVVLADGKELGRTDILNRSAHSKQINFSESYVEFFTQSQTIEIGDIAGYSKIELVLDCGFYGELELKHSIKTWTVENGGI